MNVDVAKRTSSSFLQCLLCVGKTLILLFFPQPSGNTAGRMDTAVGSWMPACVPTWALPVLPYCSD